MQQDLSISAELLRITSRNIHCDMILIINWKTKTVKVIYQQCCIHTHKSSEEKISGFGAFLETNSLLHPLGFFSHKWELVVAILCTIQINFIPSSLKLSNSVL